MNLTVKAQPARQQVDFLFGACLCGQCQDGKNRGLKNDEAPVRLRVFKLITKPETKAEVTCNVASHLLESDADSLIQVLRERQQRIFSLLDANTRIRGAHSQIAAN